MVDRVSPPRPENVFVLVPAYNAGATVEKLSNWFDFDLEMLVLARVRGLRIAEVAIPTIYAGEKSHLNPVRYGFDVLSVVRDYRRGKYHSM